MTGEAGAVRSYVDYYLTRARTQIQVNFQYRVATYMWMVGMLAEPVVYLVVWTTIAEQQGGSVQGLAFAITVPAEAVTSRLDPSTVAVAVGFTSALFACTRWWWRFGLRHYSGASA